jgi:hypothetical protein
MLLGCGSLLWRLLGVRQFWGRWAKMTQGQYSVFSGDTGARASSWLNGSVNYAGIDIEINTTAAALVAYSMTWYSNSRISGPPDPALTMKYCDAVILKIKPHGVMKYPVALQHIT